MGEPSKINLKFILAMVAVGALFFAAFVWYGQSAGPREPVSGSHLGRVWEDTAQGDHFDLLFSERGGVSYKFRGTGVMIYLDVYERGELILQERVGGLGTGEPAQLEGSLIWGITTEQNRRSEIRARVTEQGAVGFGFLDVSGIDFNPAVIAGADLGNGRIQLGRRYPLQIWKTGSTIWAVEGDVFVPERLRDNEQTIILYIVFE